MIKVDGENIEIDGNGAGLCTEFIIALMFFKELFGEKIYNECLVKVEMSPEEYKEEIHKIVSDSEVKEDK